MTSTGSNSLPCSLFFSPFSPPFVSLLVLWIGLMCQTTAFYFYFPGKVLFWSCLCFLIGLLFLAIPPRLYFWSPAFNCLGLRIKTATIKTIATIAAAAFIENFLSCQLLCSECDRDWLLCNYTGRTRASPPVASLWLSCPRKWVVRVVNLFQWQSSDEDPWFSSRAESGPPRLSRNIGLMNDWKQRPKLLPHVWG